MVCSFKVWHANGHSYYKWKEINVYLKQLRYLQYKIQTIFIYIYDSRMYINNIAERETREKMII